MWHYLNNTEILLKNNILTKRFLQISLSIFSTEIIKSSGGHKCKKSEGTLIYWPQGMLNKILAVSLYLGPKASKRKFSFHLYKHIF